MAMSGCQVAETQVYQADSTWNHPELADEDTSISIESMSLDLGELWRYGSSKSLGWDSEMDVCAVEETLRNGGAFPRLQ